LSLSPRSLHTSPCWFGVSIGGLHLDIEARVINWLSDIVFPRWLVVGAARWCKRRTSFSFWTECKYSLDCLTELPMLIILGWLPWPARPLPSSTRVFSFPPCGPAAKTALRRPFSFFISKFFGNPSHWHSPSFTLPILRLIESGIAWFHIDHTMNIWWVTLEYIQTHWTYTFEVHSISPFTFLLLTQQQTTNKLRPRRGSKKRCLDSQQKSPIQGPITPP
jgi:hypothetical protein